jgi:hypothetical protein
MISFKLRASLQSLNTTTGILLVNMSRLLHSKFRITNNFYAFRNLLPTAVQQTKWRFIQNHISNHVILSLLSLLVYKPRLICLLPSFFFFYSLFSSLLYFLCHFPLIFLFLIMFPFPIICFHIEVIFAQSICSSFYSPLPLIFCI